MVHSKALGIAKKSKVGISQLKASRGCRYRSMKSYDAQFKLKVIAFAENKGNRAAARKFRVEPSNVRYWSKQKEQLQCAKKTVLSFRGPKSGQYPEIEKELLKYVSELRNDGYSVSYERLHLKALEIAKENNVGTSQFKASRGWLCRFMKRNNLSLRRRTSQCQRLPKGPIEKEVKTSEMVEETMFIKCEPEWLQDASGTDPLVPSGSTGSGEYPDIKDEPHTEDFSHEMMEETVKSEPDWNDSVCEDIKNEITIEEDNILNIWKDHSYAEYSPDIGEGDPDEDGVVNFEDGKDILCELCNKTFTEQSSLVKHMLQHSEIKTYACELCPKIFKRQAYLTEHMSMHTKECFTCGICNQTFATSAQLYAHTAVHISKQGYVCSECNKSFIGEPSLQPLCAGENKYSCPGCKKKGAEISVPDSPPVGNNSEKTYSCLYCMKTYAFRSSLRYHMTVHRKKQPHDCMLCERNFQRKSALIKHLKKCHHLFQERDPLQ